jgi:transketolase
LRLGLGKNYPENHKKEISYTNSIKKSETPKITIIALGPIIHNVIDASIDIENIDIFTILTIPFIDNIEQIRESLNVTNKLIVIEEHVQRGGLGEYLLSYINDNKIHISDFITLNAKGYPSKTYGSQSFHQKESGLNSDSIRNVIKSLL